MLHACPNCLQVVKSPGLCNVCSALTAGFGNWVEMDEEMDGPDEVWIKQLRERRMKSYARARRMAKHG